MTWVVKNEVTHDELCMDCGLCCNGTLFKTFPVEQDKIHLFESNQSKPNSTQQTVSQKCQHLDSCNLCNIYNNRPKICEQFSCGITEEVNDNKITIIEAKILIKQLKDDPLNKDLIKRFKDKRIIRELGLS
jgi:Fe-S-cluster containining protein